MRQRGALLIGNYPPPYGGVPKHIQDLVPDLVRSGWRVHVLSSGTTGIEQHDGFTVYKDARSLPKRRFDTISFIWSVTRQGHAGILRQYAGLMPLRSFASYMGRAALGAGILDRNSIDVIAGYNLLAGAPVATILGEIYGLPVVISNFGELYSHRSLAERERGMIRRMTERSAQLLCMTRHCADSYELLDLHPPVRIVPYGIDLDRFSPGDGLHARVTLDLHAGDPVVLFVGRMIPDMGLDTLLDAVPAVVANVPAARFVIAGVRGDLTGAAEEWAARLPDHVRVVVDVPGDRLPDLYRAADLVAVPTKGARACGSLAAGEASATARPVVGARVGGVPEYVVHGETGLLVPPNDAAALAMAVSELLADPERMRSMGCQALEYVRRRFDGAVTSATMDSVLHEVVERWRG